MLHQLQVLIVLSILILAGCHRKNTTPAETTPKDDGTDLADLTGGISYKKLFTQKKFAEALKQATAQLAKTPKNPQMHYYAGFACFNLGKNEKALAHFKAALEHGGNFADLYVNYSETLFFLKKFTECEKVIRLGLKRFPGAAGLYYNMGGILVEQGKLDDAAKWFNDALLRKPNYPPALLSLGALYFNKKQLELARKTFKKLSAVKGFEIHGYLKLAYIELTQKNYDGAITLLNKASAYDPAHPMIKKFMGYAKVKKNLGVMAVLLKSKDCKGVKIKLKEFERDFPDYKEIKKLKGVISKICGK